MSNLKWCVISTRYSDKKRQSPSLEELTVCNNKEEAVRLAEIEWNHLSERDKNHSRIVAGACNIDEEEQTYVCDSFGNFDNDIYDIAWMSEAV